VERTKQATLIKQAESLKDKINAARAVESQHPDAIKRDSPAFANALRLATAAQRCDGVIAMLNNMRDVH
jgi:hypothetical protein